MRLLYAADLHGDEAHYAALAQAARDAGVVALILGGDLFAHTHTPEEQVAFARGTLSAFADGVPVPVYAIAGNVDWPVAWRQIERVVRPLTLSPTAVSPGCRVLGYPFVPPTPFRRQDFERRDLAADAAVIPEGVYRTDRTGVPRPFTAHQFRRLPSIEEDIARLGPGQTEAVWVFHTPPRGILDTATSGAHVGSRALADAIRRHQPPLVLTGHIHEAPEREGRWAARVGRTLVVNPGRGRALHAAVVEIAADGRVTGAEHTVFGRA